MYSVCHLYHLHLIGGGLHQLLSSCMVLASPQSESGAHWKLLLPESSIWLRVLGIVFLVWKLHIEMMEVALLLDPLNAAEFSCILSHSHNLFIQSMTVFSALMAFLWDTPSVKTPQTDEVSSHVSTDSFKWKPSLLCVARVYFGIQRSSWWTQWLRGAQVLWLQNKPRSSALHLRAWQLVWGVCADMLCLVFSKRAAVHYDQTSPLCSGLSKGHCSTSLSLFECNFANLSHAASMKSVQEILKCLRNWLQSSVCSPQLHTSSFS